MIHCRAVLDRRALAVVGRVKKNNAYYYSGLLLFITWYYNMIASKYIFYRQKNLLYTYEQV